LPYASSKEATRNLTAVLCTVDSGVYWVYSKKVHFILIYSKKNIKKTYIVAPFFALLKNPILRSQSSEIAIFLFVNKRVNKMLFSTWLSLRNILNLKK